MIQHRSSFGDNSLLSGDHLGPLVPRLRALPDPQITAIAKSIGGSVSCKFKEPFPLVQCPRTIVTLTGMERSVLAGINVAADLVHLRPIFDPES